MPPSRWPLTAARRVVGHAWVCWALLGAPALAAPPTPAPLERAALRITEALDGVLRNCPAGFSQIGTSDKRCVGVGHTVEQTRVALTAALGTELYGVWRSKDGQRSVYNWLKTPSGYVYLRLQPDPEGRAQTLAYLDTPPGALPAQTPATGAVKLEPVAATPATAAPVDPVPPRSVAPLPFRRTLQVQTQRMNGTDVLAVQNRLIALMRPVRTGQGDGWYGPVTAATVRAFQTSARLPATGRVDRGTWDALFSAAAQPFTPPTP
ncbi:peptidoglycan-binding protein [Deinococcus sp. HMF7620]|uniref:Peptidoglycan-binding protein n=1 Tax=Deinococcus arboris TaxID=2682977 RepID=A0A7C9HTG1_9DEIO|nr:peptidoglycan-binding domain-containing protein [Deinococcus arboris]MVN88569.1 peptidoglycan-binding protein [Deinococcus arboris]